MLTPTQIDELNILCDRLTSPVISFLFEEIIEGIKEAAQITGSNEYRIWLLKRFGISDAEIKKRIKEKISGLNTNIDDLIEETAKQSYMGDINKLAIKAGKINEEIIQMIHGTQNMLHSAIDNITGTIGFIGTNGTINPLTKAYRDASEFAYKMVSSGAMSYDQAIREATSGLIYKGIKTINYESGIVTDVGAAVRRNVLSSIGNLTNSISKKNHDELGATGWEISAHFACAPDHEDIQGKQYTNEEFEKLNSSLKRPVGTLNCGHIAFPIFIEKNKPVYSERELEEMKEQNKEGVYYNGAHFTGYEATQKQREIERKIRKQKEKVRALNVLGDQELLTEAKMKEQSLYGLYNSFCKETKLKPAYNRLF